MHNHMTSRHGGPGEWEIESNKTRLARGIRKKDAASWSGVEIARVPFSSASRVLQNSSSSAFSSAL